MTLRIKYFFRFLIISFAVILFAILAIIDPKLARNSFVEVIVKAVKKLERKNETTTTAP